MAQQHQQMPPPYQYGYDPSAPTVYVASYHGNSTPELQPDPEDPIKAVGFSEKKIRLGFIRKVYGILMVQLAITGGFIALLTFERHSQKFVYDHVIPFFITGSVVFLSTFIVLACSTKARRRAPMNFILLFSFTIALGLLLGVVVSAVDTELILLAVGITGAICLGLTLFAFQTKWDFTICSGILVTLLTIFIIFGALSPYYYPKSGLGGLGYSCLGVLIYSFLLIYDTQRIIGGKHRYSISAEEYVFAALTLYLDVIIIFLYILRCLGLAR